jgi:hypothetical protein
VCLLHTQSGQGLFQYRLGGSVRVLRGFRDHSACCRPPTPMPVDPALTARWPQDRRSGLHGPALRDMDFRNRAGSNVLSNFVSESGSTDFVNDLVRLQAEAAGDDFFLDLGGAAKDGQSPELSTAAEFHARPTPITSRQFGCSGAHVNRRGFPVLRAR